MAYIAKLARRLARLREPATTPMLASLLVLIAACSAGEPTSTTDIPEENDDPVVISPRAVTIEPDQQVRFKALESDLAGSAELTSVEWSATGGTIASDGSYRAVGTGDFRIVARKRRRPRSRPDTAVVIVVPPQPTIVAVTVTPDDPSVIANGRLGFHAVGRLSDGTTVPIGATWSASGGSIDLGGMYTAPGWAGGYQVVGTHSATGHADTVAVAVTAPTTPPTLQAVILSPGSASVGAGNSVQFAASGRMTDGSSAAVAVAFSATGGTITSTGFFAAGATAGTFRVIASQAGGSLADTAVVTVTAPPVAAPTLQAVRLTPVSVSVQAGASQQFAASGLMSDGSSAPVTVAYTATGGSVTGAGLYTAGSAGGTHRVIATLIGGTLADTSTVTVTASTAAPSGIPVEPGQSIQAAVNAAPEGATFLLKAGTHRRQTVLPKHRQTFICEPGAVLDGEGATQFAFTRRIADPDYVTIRGCHITRYAPPLQLGAIDAGWYETYPNDRTTGWTLEDSEVSYTTNGGAISVGHRMVIRRTKVHHNFQIGIVGMGDSVLVEDSEIAYNNPTNQNIGFEAGGTKFKRTRWLVVRNTFVHHNKGPGLWTDIDNVWTLFENNRVEDNTHEGIAHEISYDAVIRNNQVRRNGFAWGNPPGTGDSWGWGAGIQISASPNVEVYGNLVEANKGGIMLVQQNRGSGNRGPYLVQNVWVHHNTIVLEAANRHSGGVQDVGDNAIFTSRNNRFTDNTYRLAGAQANPFRWLNGLHTESGWRGQQQDVNGSFSR